MVGVFDIAMIRVFVVVMVKVSAEAMAGESVAGIRDGILVGSFKYPM